MDNRIDEILQQYPLKIVSQKRIRGAVMLCTENGTYIAKIYEGSKKRLCFQSIVQNKLLDAGYELIDAIVENSEGGLSCKDNRGNEWIVKRWYQGEECNIRDTKEVCLAAEHMAGLHKHMIVDSEDICCEKYDLHETFSKHNKEMKRVHTYIKDKKQKNDMEIKLLNSYSMFYSQGEEAVRVLDDSGYRRLRNESVSMKLVLHGNYTYHNILFKDDRIVTTGFDKCAVGVQIIDLYDFIRKIMEKNVWEIDMGLKVIDSYCNKRRPSKAECQVLYTLLIYPEKYWKLINFYYNSKKTWMSAKNYEKLYKICEQEKYRAEFIKAVGGLLA